MVVLIAVLEPPGNREGDPPLGYDIVLVVILEPLCRYRKKILSKKEGHESSVLPTHGDCRQKRRDRPLSCAPQQQDGGGVYDPICGRSGEI